MTCRSPTPRDPAMAPARSQLPVESRSASITALVTDLPWAANGRKPLAGGASVAVNGSAVRPCRLASLLEGPSVSTSSSSVVRMTEGYGSGLAGA